MSKRKKTKQKTPKKQAPDKWNKLLQLIAEFADATVQDSWKGGGDPEERPLREVELELARIKLEVHISQMKREQE